MRTKTIPPRLSGAIVLVFPKDTAPEFLNDVSSTNTKVDIFPECIEYTYIEIETLSCWEVDDLLTALFSRCDLERLKQMSALYRATILIDISFHHGEIYPALVFEGKNMKIIHELNANLSIDPF